MKKIILLLSFTLPCFIAKTDAQGCVAIRSNGNSCTMHESGKSGAWQLNLHNRYFRSYKHFVGTEEQKERTEKGTEVINATWSSDITVSRTLNNRWSLSLFMPFTSYARSSMYEHGGNNGGEAARHKTKSFGLGDVRFTAYRWLFDPLTSQKTNLQAGLGIKLPTGDYKVQDFFYKLDGTSVLGPVDQSIQLGDGGTGFTAELNGFTTLSKKLTVYANAFYLLNPREQNGVSTARGGTVSATAIQYGTSTMSVPDQYMFRGGVSYMVNHFTFSGGIRQEGVPAKDLAGGSKGFRRPGYVVSADPVIAFQFKKVNLYAAVPVALKRNRTKSYSDILRSEATGTDVHGDAAFADYSINFGVTVKF